MIKLLRITTVSHSLDLLLKNQLRYVGEKDIEVTIACTKDERIREIQEREKVDYCELKLTRTLNPFKDLLSLFAAIKIIRKLRPDVVHTHSPKAGIIGMLAAWICNVPLKVHTVAGLPLMETEGLKRQMLILVEKVTYLCADYVLPNSFRQKEFIEDKIYTGDKLQVIGKGSSNGIDLTYFNPDLFNSVYCENFRSGLNIEKDDIVYCFVGRLAYYKGVNELITAFCTLNNKYANVKLLLVGPFEELNPLKDSTLELLKSNKSIISVGHQNDIRPYLAISDIFVFPSYREGFPQSLMQAAAMNLACIATNINGCNEIIEDNVSGVLISPKSSEEILDKCEFLYLNWEFRIKISKNARYNMVQNFEQKKFWDKLIDFYKEKLKQR
ncbi:MULTISPECIES: glycosyltransferase family 4 protein [unclassified Sphingobacterium]|uniref:glycosyltransferase family 4 protein n=1 Tax=unclassified Sphingobacterium TaxID=2609468 RepID=UPI0025E134EC|nr:MULTISPECIES: glycosyltransferase family 4 protein [unclassified Sphingobacterium]